MFDEVKTPPSLRFPCYRVKERYKADKYGLQKK